MKRELQRSADAAALAGAAALPSENAARAAAEDYLTRNGLRDGTVSSTSITMACIAPAIDCSPYNAVRVRLVADAGTSFAKVLGVDTMSATARSTAMKSQPKKYDVMIVVDRTGSMSSNNKLTNAKAAIRTFLTMVDPEGVDVGLTVLPPAPATGDSCSAFGSYNPPNTKWVTVPLSHDYATAGVLNVASSLVAGVDCLTPNGSTHYTYALREAQAALASQGRADADNVIIFLTDGAANITPNYGTFNEKRYPCGSAATEATSIKGAGTRVYAIAYNVTDSGCLRDTQTWFSPYMYEGADPLTTLQSIASPNDYYYQPTPGQITTIFRDIAGELNSTKTKMRDDDD